MERAVPRSSTDPSRRGLRSVAALRTAAGLLGAAGVMLAAAAAHAGGGGVTMIAATFAILHAGVVIALTGVSIGSVPHGGWTLAALLMVIGSVLFSGDLALIGLFGQRPLPMAAPTGGTILILAWLLVAVSPWFRATRS